MRCLGECRLRWKKLARSARTAKVEAQLSSLPHAHTAQAGLLRTSSIPHDYANAPLAAAAAAASPPCRCHQLVLFISSLVCSRARGSMATATKLLRLLARERYGSRDTETLSNKGAGHACRRKPCLRSEGDRAPEHLTGSKPSSTAPLLSADMPDARTPCRLEVCNQELLAGGLLSFFLPSSCRGAAQFSGTVILRRLLE